MSNESSPALSSTTGQDPETTTHAARSHLSVRETFLVGVALFSMFFGAGNLIFPPVLAYQAGESTPWAFAGFIVSAIGLPVLGVVAIARAGELPKLAGNVGPRFSKAFTLLVVLAIGPMLAIPRTASTSFSMVADQFVPADALWWVQLLYTMAFFAAAYLLARNPNRITVFLGRVSGPVLLVLIAVIVAGALVNPLPAQPATQASSEYVAAPVIGGFLEGYQTMDALAALLFGMIIALNIKRLGVTAEADVTRTTSIAGIIMGIVMAVVYCGLTFAGYWASGLVPAGSPDVTGATILSAAAHALFGDAGVIIVGLIFVLACLNVCTGLLCTVSSHFKLEFPQLKYRTLLIVFTLISLALANFGLAAIIRISVPILNALYPVAIVLIFMGLAHHAVDHRPLLWKTVAGFTAVAAIVLAAAQVIWPAESPLSALPLVNAGLGWVIPALVGLIVGLIVHPKATKA